MEEMRCCSAFTNCRGDEDIDAKRSRPSIGKPVMGHARKERVGLFGTDQRITSGPAARRPHSKAEYMTAPERFADSQIPLAPRAPSIHAATHVITHPGSRPFALMMVTASGERKKVIRALATFGSFALVGMPAAYTVVACKSLGSGPTSSTPLRFLTEVV